MNYLIHRIVFILLAFNLLPESKVTPPIHHRFVQGKDLIWTIDFFHIFIQIVHEASNFVKPFTLFLNFKVPETSFNRFSLIVFDQTCLKQMISRTIITSSRQISNMHLQVQTKNFFHFYRISRFSISITWPSNNNCFIWYFLGIAIGLVYHKCHYFIG